jgi:hypothetical protein
VVMRMMRLMLLLLMVMMHPRHRGHTPPMSMAVWMTMRMRVRMVRVGRVVEPHRCEAA